MTDGGTVSEPETQGENGDDTDEPACVCEIDPGGLGCLEHYEAEGSAE